MHVVLAGPCTKTVSPNSAMNVLFTQIAALTGLFVFINQMWTYAPVEKAIFLALLAGTAVYLVMVVGDFVIRAVLDFQPPISEKEKSARARKTAESEKEAFSSTSA